jgi:hypothetical protein
VSSGPGNLLALYVTCYSYWTGSRPANAIRHHSASRGGARLEQHKRHPEHSPRHKVSTDCCEASPEWWEKEFC